MRTQEQAGLVLIVEDNRNISEMVGEYLESRGFEVDYASDGLDGYRLAAENSYDVIVLDLMLPRLDGVEVCKRLRNEARKSTPVLMLTARDTLDEKLTGLSSGADDYLTKPFAIQELEARLRALIRRERRQVGSEVLKVGDMTLDTATLKSSPRSNSAGHTRFPTFSTNTRSSSSRGRASIPRCTRWASRWHPPSVLICTAGTPQAAMRSASREVATSPSTTPQRQGIRDRVASRRVVFPAPGDPIRFTSRIPSMRQRSRIRRA